MNGPFSIAMLVHQRVFPFIFRFAKMKHLKTSWNIMKYEQESENFTISCPFSRILPVSQSDLAAHQAKWAPTSKAEAWVFWMICQFPLLTIAIANVGTLLKQNQSVTHIWSQLLFSAIKKNVPQTWAGWVIPVTSGIIRRIYPKIVPHISLDGIARVLLVVVITSRQYSTPQFLHKFNAFHHGF